MFGSIGMPELIIILVIALIIIGPGKLPEVGSALGRSIREFRKAATDVKEATSLTPTPTAPAGPGAATPTAATPPTAAATSSAPAAGDADSSGPAAS